MVRASSHNSPDCTAAHRARAPAAPGAARVVRDLRCIHAHPPRVRGGSMERTVSVMQAPYAPPHVYEHSRRIDVLPDAVYAYVADITRLPTYMPAIQHAELVGDERVRIETASGGGVHQADGTIKSEPDKRRIEWSSDPGDYQGTLVVSDEVDHSRVIVRLTFTSSSDYPQEIESAARKPDPIDRALEAALDSLKNILEGEGGAVSPERE